MVIGRFGGIVAEQRQGNSGKYAENGDDDHQFGNGKTLLFHTTTFNEVSRKGIGLPDLLE